jgi:O-antigen/teichoic acid export membrane protein
MYTRLDIILLGQLASTAALGLYNVAYKPTTLATYLGGTVAGTLFPLLVQVRETGAPVAFRRAVRGLGAAAPAMALALSGLAGPLLYLLYGEEFRAAAPALILLAWSAAANWLYAPLGIALQARGHERWWLASLVGALMLNAAGNIWAIPRWGPTGAAASTLASEVALIACAALLVGRRLRFLPAPRPVLVGLGAAAASAFVLWVLGPIGPIPATLAALAVYGGCLMSFGIVTSEDASLLMGWIRQAAMGTSRG